MSAPRTGPHDAVVDRLGTAAWCTTVYRRDGGHLWSRGRGPRCPAPWGAPWGPADRVARTHTVFRDVVAVSGDDPVTFVVRGAYSLASVLIGRTGTPPPALAGAVGDAVDVVAGWRDAPCPAEAPRPRPLRELRDWLDGRCDADLRRLRDTVLGALGPVRSDALLECVEDLWAAEPRTVVHGEIGLGSLVPDESGTAVQVVGPLRWSAGPAAFDHGWLLGEVVELSTRMPEHRIAERRILDRTAAAVARSAVERADVARVAILRIVFHLSEYRRYVGPIPNPETEAARLTELFDRLWIHGISEVGTW